MTRQNLNTPTVPTQAQIDAALARGSRARSAAFRGALKALASLFAGSRAQPTQIAFGNTAN